MTRYHGNVSKYLNLSEVRINQIFSYVIHFAGRYMFTTNDEQTLWLAGWLAGWLVIPSTTTTEIILNMIESLLSYKFAPDE